MSGAIQLRNTVAYPQASIESHNADRAHYRQPHIPNLEVYEFVVGELRKLYESGLKGVKPLVSTVLQMKGLAEHDPESRNLHAALHTPLAELEMIPSRDPVHRGTGGAVTHCEIGLRLWLRRSSEGLSSHELSLLLDEGGYEHSDIPGIIVNYDLVIGTGGFGTLYNAYCFDTGAPVAYKRFHNDKADNASHAQTSADPAAVTRSFNPAIAADVTRLMTAEQIERMHQQVEAMDPDKTRGLTLAELEQAHRYVAGDEELPEVVVTLEDMVVEDLEEVSLDLEDVVIEELPEGALDSLSDHERSASSSAEHPVIESMLASGGVDTTGGGYSSIVDGMIATMAMIGELSARVRPAFYGANFTQGKRAIAVEKVFGRPLSKEIEMRTTRKRGLFVSYAITKEDLIRLSKLFLLAYIPFSDEDGTIKVFHRDIKPDNGIVDVKGGRCSIVDFDHSLFNEPGEIARVLDAMEDDIAFGSPFHIHPDILIKDDDTVEKTPPISAKTEFHALTTSLDKLTTGIGVFCNPVQARSTFGVLTGKIQFRTALKEIDVNTPISEIPEPYRAHVKKWEELGLREFFINAYKDRYTTIHEYCDAWLQAVNPSSSASRTPRWDFEKDLEAGASVYRRGADGTLLQESGPVYPVLSAAVDPARSEGLLSALLRGLRIRGKDKKD